MRSRPSPEGSDAGSAVVEFIFVGVLVVAVALGITQLALTVHSRNVLMSAASEGAHVAALADRTASDGAARARDLASRALGGRAVEAIANEAGPSGLVRVQLSTRAPAFVWWGSGTITVVAHAVEEAP